MNPLRLPLATLLFLLVCALPAFSAEPWEDEAAFRALRKNEIKTLKGLLKTALKKDYRRQAWSLAERLAVIAPEDGQAAEVLERWEAKELQIGMVPKKAWLKKRDATLRKLGDKYFHFGETLNASGMEPIKYQSINVRARAYGSRAGPLLEALESKGHGWYGVYGPQPREEVERLLGNDALDSSFPEEFADDYLRARVVWPKCRAAGWHRWRLLSDHGYKESMRLLGMLASAETWLIQNVGSNAPKNDRRITNLYVFSEWQKYDQIGIELVRERNVDTFKESSGWSERRRGVDPVLLVCWRHRHNAFLGDDDLMLGHAAKVMARMHLAAGAGGEVWGRGAWLLEGLRGAFEGFSLDAEGAGQIDPGACWRLSAARALRDANKLVPWKTFFELDRRKALALPREDIQISFGGKSREAKAVDVVAAQATALVIGIIQSDPKRGLIRLAKLIGNLYKRDRLPDLNKAMGWKKGRAIEIANEAMDAVPGRDAAEK